MYNGRAMNTKTKTILAIETSCDETAVAIVDVFENEITVRSHLILSQASLHAEFGGVFPNLAKREHARTLPTLIKKALEESNLLFLNKKSVTLDNALIETLLNKDGTLKETLLPFLKETQPPKIDAIAVTMGPGLEPALWVGFNTARALSITWNAPFYPMNHMEGHIVASLLQRKTENTCTLTDIPLPALAVLLSGGHTEFDLVRTIGSYERIGETLDDAVGEAYDKAARLMGLSYPGGPKIALLAEEARSFKTPSPVKLPRPMTHSRDLNTSFSGLKTAVRYAIEKISPLTDEDKRGLAGEFENAVTEVLIRKAHTAIETTNVESLILGGGVSANTFIRNAFMRLAQEHSIPLLLPDPVLATDNALMIAVACALRLNKGKLIATNPLDQNLAVNGTLRLA